MAVWQCDFRILPEGVFNRPRAGIPHQLSAKQFNRIDLSVRQWLPDNHADQISELLPEIASWSPNLRWWGSEIGDRIDLLYKNGKVIHFKIRIDVRRINIVLLRDFLELLREWRCVICSADTGQVLRPTRSAVLNYLGTSPTLATTWRWLGNQSDDDADASRQRIFICHSSKDKPFVRKLAGDLKSSGLSVWFDDWELLPGDSLSDKIQDGISESSWLLIILSNNSVESQWVRRELNAGLAEEMKRKDAFIVPVRVDFCKIPLFLRDKLYGDFRTSYKEGFAKLLRRFGSAV